MAHIILIIQQKMASIKLRPMLLHEENGNQRDGNGQIVDIESKAVSVTQYERERKKKKTLYVTYIL